MPYFSSNFWVRKKFRTDPSREKARVTPKASASSFPLNQKAVILFWTTDKERRQVKRHCTKYKNQSFYELTLLVKDPFPDPKSSRPVSISGSRYEVPLKWEPSANSAEPKTHRKENRNTPTAERKNKEQVNQT